MDNKRSWSWTAAASYIDFSRARMGVNPTLVLAGTVRSNYHIYYWELPRYLKPEPLNT